LAERDVSRRGWRKLHNEVLNLYPSANVTKTVKSRKLKLAIYVEWRRRDMDKNLTE
jgi:hypothetical protein